MKLNILKCWSIGNIERTVGSNEKASRNRKCGGSPNGLELKTQRGKNRINSQADRSDLFPDIIRQKRHSINLDGSSAPLYLRYYLPTRTRAHTRSWLIFGRPDLFLLVRDLAVRGAEPAVLPTPCFSGVFLPSPFSAQDGSVHCRSPVARRHVDIGPVY